MRWLIVGLVALFVWRRRKAAPLRPADLASTAAVLRWISHYRHHPRPNDVPAAMRPSAAWAPSIIRSAAASMSAFSPACWPPIREKPSG